MVPSIFKPDHARDNSYSSTLSNTKHLTTSKFNTYHTPTSKFNVNHIPISKFNINLINEDGHVDAKYIGRQAIEEEARFISDNAISDEGMEMRSSRGTSVHSIVEEDLERGSSRAASDNTTQDEELERGLSRGSASAQLIVARPPSAEMHFQDRHRELLKDLA